MKLTPVQQKFILHWGEMGTRWGINRTVAQIHALLYLSGDPLPAEEIADTLGVARSNVSTSQRELQGWGIVRALHLLGDRRDHFATMTDVWEMFRIILEERKRREIDPTLAVLRECVEQARGSSAAEAGLKATASARRAWSERRGRMVAGFGGVPECRGCPQPLQGTTPGPQAGGVPCRRSRCQPCWIPCPTFIFVLAAFPN